MKLSKRDYIMLTMMALAEIDDRIASTGRQNKINFSGVLSESENQAYLEKVSEEMLSWSETTLLIFTFDCLNSVSSFCSKEEQCIFEFKLTNFGQTTEDQIEKNRDAMEWAKTRLQNLEDERNKS